MKQLILEDTESYKEVELKIEERLLQVSGKLLAYDTVGENYFTIIEESFLCVDRLAAEDGNQFNYLIHVTNLT